MVELVARAQLPRGTVPESGVAGLDECVRSGYLDWPGSVVPLLDCAYLRRVAPTVMATPGIGGFLGSSVFVARCSDLPQSTLRDFPEAGPRADNEAEVTMLARWLDSALVEPSEALDVASLRQHAARASGRVVATASAIARVAGGEPAPGPRQLLGAQKPCQVSSGNSHHHGRDCRQRAHALDGESRCIQ